MKTSQKGVCRRCGVARETGNHKKCDTWLSRTEGWTHVANNKATTGKDLKRFAESVSDDAPIGFVVKILWYAKEPK